MEEQRYYNFPVTILQGFIEQPKVVADQIENWALYDYFMRLHPADTGTSTMPRYKLFQEVLDVFGLKLAAVTGSNLYNYYEHCGKIHAKYHGARTGAKQSMIREIIDYSSSLVEEFAVGHLACWAAKSIIGKKTYCKTNKLLFFARMNGYERAFASEDELKQKCHPVILKYTTRRRFDRLMRQILGYFGISYYSCHDRGFYISSKLNYNNLVLNVECNRKPSVESLRNRASSSRNKMLEKLRKQQQ